MSTPSIFVVTYIKKTSNGHFPHGSDISSATVRILSLCTVFTILQLDSPDWYSGNAIESYCRGSRSESPNFQEPDDFCLFMYFFPPSMALQHFDLGRFFSFLILYTVSRSPWTGGQPVAKQLPTHRINAHRHPCFEWEPNRRPPAFSGRRLFMP
jgi:hypothetical protein